MDYISICNSLLKYFKKSIFKQTVTGDENHIIFQQYGI